MCYQFRSSDTTSTKYSNILADLPMAIIVTFSIILRNSIYLIHFATSISDSPRAVN